MLSDSTPAPPFHLSVHLHPPLALRSPASRHLGCSFARHSRLRTKTKNASPSIALRPLHPPREAWESPSSSSLSQATLSRRTSSSPSTRRRPCRSRRPSSRARASESLRGARRTLPVRVLLVRLPYVIIVSGRAGDGADFRHLSRNPRASSSTASRRTRRPSRRSVLPFRWEEQSVETKYALQGECPPIIVVFLFAPRRDPPEAKCGRRVAVEVVFETKTGCVTASPSTGRTWWIQSARRRIVRRRWGTRSRVGVGATA